MLTPLFLRWKNKRRASFPFFLSPVSHSFIPHVFIETHKGGVSHRPSLESFHDLLEDRHVHNLRTQCSKYRNRNRNGDQESTQEGNQVRLPEGKEAMPELSLESKSSNLLGKEEGKGHFRQSRLHEPKSRGKESIDLVWRIVEGFGE